MANVNKTGWEEDFKFFLEAEASQVPLPLSEKISSMVASDLRPSFWKVLIKLAGIQALAGGVSLLFCPQFGISFVSTHGLMPYLMRFGEGICMVGCGALFTGVSLLMASFVLRSEEVRALREHRLFQLAAVTALSLAAFICGGAEVVGSLALAWALGALLGGALTLELGWSVRKLSYGRGTL